MKFAMLIYFVTVSSLRYCQLGHSLMVVVSRAAGSSSSLTAATYG